MAALIAAQRDEHQIPHATACRALGVSRSWFYKWKDDALTPRAARRQALAAEVRRLFSAHRGTYGSPRITADLREAGWKVSKNTVAAVMREQGLAARRKKKRRSTTRPGKGRWRAPDLVKRDFPAQQVNRKWYGDGTEIPHRRGQALPGLGDGHGLPAGARVRAGRAPRRASWPTRAGHGGGGARRPGPRRHHAHRQGSEYTAGLVRQACERLGIRQSMGRPGSALDNAVIESWHSTLEFELRSLEHFATRAAARARVSAWIEDYNTHRRHSALGMMSPVGYEQALKAGKAA